MDFYESKDMNNIEVTEEIVSSKFSCKEFEFSGAGESFSIYSTGSRGIFTLVLEVM